MKHCHHPQEAQMLACAAKKVTVYRVCLGLFVSLFLAFNAVADSSIRNVTPLTQGIGLPVLLDGPLDEGQQQLITSYNQSSFFVASHPNNRLFMDGELNQLELSYRAGWKGLQWYISLPFIRYSGGVLDGFIDGWHEAFDLPDGNREDFARNQLNFYYRSNHKTWQLNSAEHNIGGLRLAIGKQYSQSEYAKHSFYVHAKIPTSDNIWFSVPSYDVAALLNHKFQGHLWQLTLQYGVMLMSDTKHLPLRKSAFVGVAQLNYQAAKDVQAVLQFDFHTRLYNEHGDFFRNGGLLGMGFYYQPKRIRYSAMLVEDLITVSSADVSFVFSLQQLW